MDNPYCEKSTFCDYGNVSNAGEPCKTCFSDGTFSFFKASIGRPARIRMIGDEPLPIVAVESDVPMPDPTEQTKITETVREATRRWEDAEKEAISSKDEKRLEAIRKVLNEYLRENPRSKIVTLPDPSKTDTDDLCFDKLWLSIGRSRGR